jgi:hypothetical protein
MSKLPLSAARKIVPSKDALSPKRIRGGNDDMDEADDFMDESQMAIRNDGIFTDQQYIDYACMQDRNRTLKVDPYFTGRFKNEKLIRVMVDSYFLPDSINISRAMREKKVLDSAENIVRCNWEWFRRQVVPEVAKQVEEQLYGIKVVTGVGLDSSDLNVSRRDVVSMVSFLGKVTLVTGFVSPPATHKPVELAGNDFKPNWLAFSPMMQLNHLKRLTSDFKKHVSSLGIKTPPPPLPREQYQICRLKWIPTENPEAEEKEKYERGYFQGLYQVKGTELFSRISLLNEWVVRDFDPSMLKEVKEVGVTGQKQPPGLLLFHPENQIPILFLQKIKFTTHEERSSNKATSQHASLTVFVVPCLLLVVRNKLRIYVFIRIATL